MYSSHATIIVIGMVWLYCRELSVFILQRNLWSWLQSSAKWRVLDQDFARKYTGKS